MAFDLSMPILVVDDYSTMIRIIRNLLKQLGFENVDDASDGSAALAKMQTKRYGLVISDWNMEPMTGYDLLKEVRASPEFSKTPFIMITAESKTENVIAAKKAGVNNYIVKPFNAATLKTKMEAVFPGSADWYLPEAHRGLPGPAPPVAVATTRAAHNIHFDDLPARRRRRVRDAAKRRRFSSATTDDGVCANMADSQKDWAKVATVIVALWPYFYG
jgi:two-component system, chemotaxis family, chemotaxis protein CheY